MQDLVQVNDQLSSQDLFNAFKLQLTKDFEQSNFQADFIKVLEPNFARIHEKIVHELQRSGNRADSNLMQLLYRIDISEGQLKKYLNDGQNENHLISIAELIIKRVLQKVVTKQYYKRNENPQSLFGLLIQREALPSTVQHIASSSTRDDARHKTDY